MTKCMTCYSEATYESQVDDKVFVTCYVHIPLSADVKGLVF